MPALVLIVSLLAHAPESEARRRHRYRSVRQQASTCGGNAQSTTYFVPNVVDYCKSAQPCAGFQKEVRMQGSGTLPGNRLLLASGKTRSMGSCQTAYGAAGQCLIPFISVAADSRYHSMGEIISMPSLKGKKIKLPNGRTFEHPGYLVVQDVGGAIKGSNRFDFFTGSYSNLDPRNPFGPNYKDSSPDSDFPNMGARNSCKGKSYDIVSRQKGEFQDAMAAIKDFQIAMEGGSGPIRVASAAK